MLELSAWASVVAKWLRHAETESSSLVAGPPFLSALTASITHGRVTLVGMKHFIKMQPGEVFPTQHCLACNYRARFWGPLSPKSELAVLGNTAVSYKPECLSEIFYAQLRSEGTLEPLNAAALPPGGLRQDHHGYESMPVSPAEALPYSAVLSPNNSTASLSNATGIVNLLVAPDNSSIVSTSLHLHLSGLRSF